MRRVTASLPVVVVAALATIATGTSYAFWSTHGTGTGSATVLAGNPGAGLSTGTATPTTLLRPGLTGDAAVAITNNNSYAVSLTGVTLGTSSATGCTTPALTYPTPTGYTVNGAAASLPVSIPAGATRTIVVTGGVAMGTTASNDCQNKTLSIPLSLSWTN